jgi:hypothetical protein
MRFKKLATWLKHVQLYNPVALLLTTSDYLANQIPLYAIWLN